MALAKKRSRVRSMGSTEAGSSWPIHLRSIMAARSDSLVQRHHAGAAESEVVLQRQARTLHLALVRRAPQLLNQLGALGKARGAERMPLGQQAARRIGDDPPAIAVVAVADELLGAARRAQAQGFVGDQLVVGEAVVQLDDVE